MKSINTVAGTGNPVKITDLATLWDSMMMGLYGRSGDGIATILSGCEWDGSVMNIGVIFFTGEPFTLMEPALAGQYLYAQVKQEDNRTYEDGTVRPFYTNRVINVSDSGTETTLGTLIGEVKSDNIAMWTWVRIPDYAINNSMLSSGCVMADNIYRGAVVAGKIANNAVITVNIADLNVTTNKLGNNAVITRKIADGAVTSIKIANGAVGYTQLADGAVSTQKLAEESVGTNQLIDGSVTNDILADLSISGNKIKDRAISSIKLALGSVGGEIVVNGGISTAKIVDKAVTFEKLAVGSVGTVNILDEAVTADKIALHTITVDEMAEQSIGTDQLMDGCVDNSKIGINAVNTLEIMDGAVTEAKLAVSARIPTAEVLKYDLNQTPTVNIAGPNQIVYFYGNPANNTIQVDMILNFISYAGSTNVYYFSPMLQSGMFVDIYVAGKKVANLTGPNPKTVKVTQTFDSDGPGKSGFLDVVLLDEFFEVD